MTNADKYETGPNPDKQTSFPITVFRNGQPVFHAVSITAARQWIEAEKMSRGQTDETRRP